MLEAMERCFSRNAAALLEFGFRAEIQQVGGRMNENTIIKSRQSFGFVDFLVRWLAALVLVFTTYNPSGWSWFHWARGAYNSDGLDPLHYFSALILVAGWTMFIVATQRSLGMLGTILGTALIGTAIWLLVDIGILKAGSMQAITWLALFTLATLLAIGLSWSHIWKRMSGQLEVDDE